VRWLKFGSFAGFGRVSEVRPANVPNVRRLSFYNERQRLMVWCRAGVRGEYLSVYTDFFYEPQTLGNP